MGKASEPGGMDGDGAPHLEMLTSPDAKAVFAGMYENLIATAVERYPSVVLVCCASRREGATTIASGLAIAASQCQDGDILLIDFNYSNPDILEVFRRKEGPLASTPLQGEKERLVADVIERNEYRGSTISRTPFANLMIIDTAKALKNHLQYLESLRFRKMLDELSKLFNFIVIDGPSVNTYPDSSLLSSQVDQVLLVLHSGSTRVPVASRAAERLSMGGRAPQVILNRRKFPIPQSVYRRL